MKRTTLLTGGGYNIANDPDSGNVLTGAKP